MSAGLRYSLLISLIPLTLSLVIVIGIVGNSAEQVENTALLTTLNVLTQGSGYSFFFGFLAPYAPRFFD